MQLDEYLAALLAEGRMTKALRIAEIGAGTIVTTLIGEGAR